MRAKIKAGEEEMKDGVEEIKATVRASQKEMETRINFIQSKLEEAIRNWVEDSLLSVHWWTQDLCKELNTKIE